MVSAHKESYKGLGVNIKHVLWEANKYVECLVNLGGEQTTPLVVYDHSPTSRVQFLNFDVLAIATARMVSLQFSCFELRPSLV